MVLVAAVVGFAFFIDMGFYVRVYKIFRDLRKGF